MLPPPPHPICLWRSACWTSGKLSLSHSYYFHRIGCSSVLWLRYILVSKLSSTLLQLFGSPPPLTCEFLEGMFCWVRIVSSKCSPYTNSMNIIWEFDRIANYFSHPGPIDEKLWGWGPQTSALQVILTLAKVWKTTGLKDLFLIRPAPCQLPPTLSFCVFFLSLSPFFFFLSTYGLSVHPIYLSCIFCQ